uniref:Uncharacterized protein n=1 Tax=Arundo donax TaxID=35708 RepID=A0A0A9CK85_ARUDO
MVFPLNLVEMLTVITEELKYFVISINFL